VFSITHMYTTTHCSGSDCPPNETIQRVQDKHQRERWKFRAVGVAAVDFYLRVDAGPEDKLLSAAGAGRSKLAQPVPCSGQPNWSPTLAAGSTMTSHGVYASLRILAGDSVTQNLFLPLLAKPAWHNVVIPVRWHRAGCRTSGLFTTHSCVPPTLPKATTPDCSSKPHLVVVLATEGHTSCLYLCLQL
jgi:hypothetical protein